ncbi:DsbA family protein [Gaopeijia maritima]|uniref:Thioredoxin domain-containing protein n=1 Tax=Gaopeijia maritima TaxID=3119007 RepID=A0ABU9E6Y1_9BACT
MGKKIEKVIDGSVVVAMLAAVLAAGTVLIRGSATDATPSGDGERVRAWEQYSEGGRRTGPPDAAITIVEFGDYRCAACQTAEDHFSAVRRKFSDVAFVYRHFPIPVHEFSTEAAVAAECAGEQGLFWPMHEELYNMETVALDSFPQAAQRVGVKSLSDFRACLSSEEPRARIEADRVLARQLGVRGTPTFLVNDRKYLGFRDSLALEEILAEAR